jgi:acyl carrier protein
LTSLKNAARSGGCHAGIERVPCLDVFAAAANYFDMGLDAVEIVMAIEDAFDISIENSEAEKILTPRQLIDLVQSKVLVATSRVCLTQRAFNLLRKSLLRNGQWKRADIAPATRLSVLIPRPQRQALLQQTALELGIKKPPGLKRRQWLEALRLGMTLVAGLGVMQLAYPGLASLAFLLPFFVFAGVAILIGYISGRLTENWRTEFPKDLQTVGDLARWVMTHKPDLAQATVPGWTRNQIAGRVREIIVDVLGCKPDFSEDANFVKDLGLS